MPDVLVVGIIVALVAVVVAIELVDRDLFNRSVGQSVGRVSESTLPTQIKCGQSIIHQHSVFSRCWCVGELMTLGLLEQGRGVAMVGKRWGEHKPK